MNTQEFQNRIMSKDKYTDLKCYFTVASLLQNEGGRDERAAQGMHICKLPTVWAIDKEMDLDLVEQTNSIHWISLEQSLYIKLLKLS